jgi:hypothetical protein
MVYLSDLPQTIQEYGFCKVLAVRREVIHIKHILTDVFVRKTIKINDELFAIGWDLFDYMEYITNRLRLVHHFSREYKNNLNDIVKSDRDKFFPTIKLLEGLNVCIVLDFDGVVTKNSFKNLYSLCLERCDKVYICTANPGVKEDWFEKCGYALPNKIYACKGKQKKIVQLIEITKRHDYVFYIDNEINYLDIAWLFGIQTYHYTKNKIVYYTRKTK